MQVSFSAAGDIQIVEIGGILNETEAAAVRSKLGEKINQGRLKLLFDLTNFNFADNTSRSLVFGLLTFSLNLGALCACGGVPQSVWPLFVLPQKLKPQLFLSRAEGQAYLSKNSPPNQKSTPADPLAKPVIKTEEVIRDSALTEILQKYEVFQLKNDYDPYRLDFWIEQYKTSPSFEAISNAKRASEKMEMLADELTKLDKECVEMARKLKVLMRQRRTPLSSGELESKKGVLTNEIKENKTSVEKMKASLAAILKQTQAFRDRATNTKKANDALLKDLVNKVDQTLKENQTLETELQARDAREEADLESKKKSLN